jgi:hypothetical protein
MLGRTPEWDTPVRSHDAPSGPGFGVFCTGAAVAMALQTIYTYRNGYMYCGRNEVVYRKDNPRKFKFWLVVQTFFVLFLIAGAVYGFLT